MATQNVLMPQMGESIQEGTLTRWHKKLGERVQREEILFEISTDKVDTEIPSPVSGVLVQILAKEGETVSVNSVVAVIDDAASPGAVVQSQPAEENTRSSRSKRSLESVEPPAASAPSSENSAKVLASPLARKMAEEHAVDLSKLQGSGEGNKIVKNDVLAVLESGGSVSPLVASAAAAASAPVSKAPAEHVKSTGGASEGIIDGVRVNRVPMSGMRKKIAEHMVMSKRTSPHVTSAIEIDLQKIVSLRAKFKDKFEATHGFKLTFMPFFLHAVIEAIKAVPIVNASVDNDSILYKKDINLGCAVALDWGLIVPVIKNASERSFVGLGRELNFLAEKARNKKLAPDDVRGGTFSISNFGGFGTVIGQPIINQPQVAIFGIGAMQKKAVVIDDAIAIRTMSFCVLTFDHRVIDGSDSGKFLSTVKNVIENWNVPII
ncbi:dihydrolipoamide acetyltransferase family protein [Spirobacillus cienkowskii]|uniref:dihydrolipoamide acetyltransferase family protein n=1 Tax=Spirobacillus cienkowskii TaxID=495820 RepID=UPI0030D2C7E4